LEQSINGPSFRIQYSDFESGGYGTILSVIATEYVDYEWSEVNGEYPIRNVFIPMLNGLDQNQTATWHITTRNFFAFCFGVPLIGYSLSEALILLHERVEKWTGRDAKEALSQYLRRAGYLDLTHAPEHALGILCYAETHSVESLWRTAFAHCVGMADALSSATDFVVTSISRAFSKLTCIEEALRYHKASH
jgi:hypothetical protein